METQEAVILIGHGAAASDTPRPLVEELKKLEMRRRAQKILQMSPREAELDKQVRQWPRTHKTDPYKYGLEKILETLQKKLSDKHVVLAFNEFCAPSVEEIIAQLVNQGFKQITLISTMFTRGGIHAEVEIPEIVVLARKQHPNIRFEYIWPFDLSLVADFLTQHIQKIRVS
ncbi:MAG: hypothetical protein HY399_02725 [Elusimicrobia bacterium]|nr:hypothetical protein [Elusimicrobiota bacterium]